MVVLGGGAVSYERGTPVGLFGSEFSRSEEGSYLRLTDLLAYHSTLGSRVIKKKSSRVRRCICAFHYSHIASHSYLAAEEIQGYLAHKKQPPP